MLICEMLFDLFFSSILQTFRVNDISKYFRESLGLRDKESTVISD